MHKIISMKKKASLLFLVFLIYIGKPLWSKDCAERQRQWQSAKDLVNQAKANQYSIHFNEAMNHYIAALRILDSIPTNTSTDSLRGVTYIAISDIFMDCEMYETSKETYFKALDYCCSANDSVNIALCYRKIGNICYYLSDTENPDTLLHYIQKSISFAQDESPYISAFYITLIASLKDKETAKKFLPERIKGITLLPIETDKQTPYLENYAAWALWVSGENEKAIGYAKQNTLSSDIKLRVTSLELLSVLSLDSGDTTTAVASLQQIDSLNRIINEEKRKAASIEHVFSQYEKERCEMKTTSTSHTIETMAILAALTIVSIIIMCIRKKQNGKKANSSWNDFLKSEIYNKITEKCESEKGLTAANVSASNIRLTKIEMDELEQEINKDYADFATKFRKLHPDINDGEWQYIMVSMLKTSEVEKSALLGLSYQGCTSRRNRVLEKLKTDNLNDYLQKMLKT